MAVASQFCFDSNRPDEAKQLASDGGNDLRFVLAPCQQLFVAGAQSPLRFPGDGFGLLIQTLLGG
jgi:hypothetical protein